MSGVTSTSPTQPPKRSAPVAGSGRVGRGLLPIFLLGLVLILLGERVIVTEDAVSVIVTMIGVVAVVGATALRFVGAGQAASVHRLLGGLSVLGCLGVSLYFASTPAGLQVLGLSGLERSTASQVQGVLTIAWAIAIWLAVVGLVFAELALVPMRGADRLEVPRVRAAAAGGLSLALSAAYCSLFVYSASKSDLKADYSYFKTSEPSESSRAMVAGMTEPLKVTAFFPEVNEVRSEVDRYLRALLEPRGEAAPQATSYQSVDRYLEPKLAQDMKVSTDGVVVFERGSERQSLTIGTDMSAARARLKTLDKDVQQTLLKLLRARRVAYLTTGHGELNASTPEASKLGRSADLVQNILRMQNYQVSTLGLVQGLGREVPDDAELVLVLGPTEPFAPEELAALGRYLARGGHVLLALDAHPLDAPNADPVTGNSSTDTSALQALAELAGVTYSPGLLVHESQYMKRRANNSDRSILVSSRFSSHASVSTLSRNSARAAVIFARAGSIAAGSKEGHKVDLAVRVNSGTFVDLDGNYSFDSATEKKSDLGLAAAVTHSVSAPAPHDGASGGAEGAKDKEMRAFVLADADCLSDVVLSNFGPNRLLFADAIRWLGGEESFVGEISTEEDVRIEHTKQKDQVWFYATIFGAPLAVLAAGLFIARRQRLATGVKA